MAEMPRLAVDGLVSNARNPDNDLSAVLSDDADCASLRETQGHGS
jgi:hypothetical protein